MRILSLLCIEYIKFDWGSHSSTLACKVNPGNVSCQTGRHQGCQASADSMANGE